jgi:hypothetical protein
MRKCCNSPGNHRYRQYQDIWWRKLCMSPNDDAVWNLYCMPDNRRYFQCYNAQRRNLCMMLHDDAA